MRGIGWVCLLFGLSLAPPALSEEVRQVDGARIRLSDVVPAAQDLGDIDLGPAPPPGSSRLLPKEELVRLLADAGVETKSVRLPAVVRVIRTARRLSAAEVTELAHPVLRRALPDGARLIALSARRGIVTSKSSELSTVRLPKLPKRVGQVTLTVTAELSEEGAVVARVPLRAVLEVDERATRPAVARGARLDLMIERGAASVSASAVALGDGDVGDVVSFKVETTQKVLRGRIETRERARVVVR
jgi:hypothetical protein